MTRLVTVYDDKEPLNNVISALTLDVDEVFYVYHHEVSRNRFKNIRVVLKKYKNLKAQFIQLENDEEQIRELIADKESTITDVGGAKYLSLLLFEMAEKNGNRIVYFDDEENVIKVYRGHKVIAKPAFHLQIEDVLKLRGGEIKASMHKPSTDYRTRKTIIELVENNLGNYSTLIKFITKINSILSSSRKRSARSYILSTSNVRNIMTDATYSRIGDLFTIDENVLTFRTAKLRELIGVSGAFLENYLYIKLSESKQFDDIRMSADIDFSDERHIQPVRCEIDCLIIKDNRMLFVSCKSTKADTDDLNEIYVHNSMFGNALSSPVLCIADEMDHQYPSIYAKAEELGVYVADLSSFENDGIVNTFTEIINGTYHYDILPR